MLLVQSGRDARVILPRSAQQERYRIPGRVDHRQAPHQDADFELGLCFDQRTQEVTERRTVIMVRTKLDASVEIPTDDQDRSLRLTERLIEPRIVVRRIDQDRGLIGPCDAPAIPPRFEDAHLTFLRDSSPARGAISLVLHHLPHRRQPAIRPRMRRIRGPARSQLFTSTNSSRAPPSSTTSAAIPDQHPRQRKRSPSAAWRAQGPSGNRRPAGRRFAYQLMGRLRWSDTILCVSLAVGQ
jgi:hypothetical protein